MAAGKGQKLGPVVTKCQATGTTLSGIHVGVGPAADSRNVGSKWAKRFRITQTTAVQ